MAAKAKEQAAKAKETRKGGKGEKKAPTGPTAMDLRIQEMTDRRLAEALEGSQGPGNWEALEPYAGINHRFEDEKGTWLGQGVVTAWKGEGLSLHGYELNQADAMVMVNQVTVEGRTYVGRDGKTLEKHLEECVDHPFRWCLKASLIKAMPKPGPRRIVPSAVQDGDEGSLFRPQIPGAIGLREGKLPQGLKLYFWSTGLNSEDDEKYWLRVTKAAADQEMKCPEWNSFPLPTDAKVEWAKFVHHQVSRRSLQRMPGKWKELSGQVLLILLGML